jgi:hypothetical protein
MDIESLECTNGWGHKVGVTIELLRLSKKLCDKIGNVVIETNSISNRHWMEL